MREKGIKIEIKMKFSLSKLGKIEWSNHMPTNWTKLKILINIQSTKMR